MTAIDETRPAEARPGRTRFSPRLRQRISRSVQYALFIGLIALFLLTADWGPIREHFADIDVAKTMFPKLITVAMKNTIIYTLSAYVVGFLLGLVIALMRLSSVAPYRYVALTYIEIFRGLPVLVVFLIFAFGLPVAIPGLKFPLEPYGTVAIALGLVTSAYLAETFRAGIEAVPRGQMEAARSLGMPYMRAMVSIILPQAMRIVIPPMTNALVLLFKDSSLVYVLGVTAATTELTKFGGDVSAEFADTTPLIAIGVAYLFITVPLGYVVRLMEARQRRAR